MDPSFHLDSHIRIDNQRHAGIVVKGDKILLLKRFYKGKSFYVIPGGHIQIGEDPINAVEREIKEETSILVNESKLVFEFVDLFNNKKDFYYLCKYISGEPKLGGEEELKNSPDNSYEPKYLNLNEIDNLNLLPIFAKEWIITNLIK